MEGVLLALVIASIALRFHLASHRNVNWDEFYYLSFVHDYLRGSLTLGLQTIHVHFFNWLPSVFPDEIAEIVGARFVMATLRIMDAALLYGIGRRFASRAGALCAVLAYLSVAFVLEHDTSFRSDPMITALMLIAFFAVLRWPGGTLGSAVAGAASALAVLISVKSAFHLVALAAVYGCLLFGARERRPVLLAGATFAASFCMIGLALYRLHAHGLTVELAQSAGAVLTGSARMLLFSGDMPKVWTYLLVGFRDSAPSWALILSGAIRAAVAARIAQGAARWDKLLPLALALPLCSFAFYRNSFPYFYVFALAPAAVLAGLSFDAIRRRPTPGARLAVGFAPLVFLVALVAAQAYAFARNFDDQTLAQRQTLAVVHATFPEPVRYLDGYGIVARFPRAGFFMSSWGMEAYLDAGKPIFADLAAADPPILVLADSNPLMAALIPARFIPPLALLLLPADERFLQENYLRYWGMLFLPGKRIQSTAGGAAVEFDIIIPGGYRLASRAGVVVDDLPVAPDQTIELQRGPHRLAWPSGAPAAAARLEWAAAPPPPSEPSLDTKFFVNFLDLE